MAYTVIEAQRLTGVSSHTIRFWAKKGLFPFVDRDEHGVKYFSQSDINWIIWIECFRKTGMSLKDIRRYIELSASGLKTAQERKDMLVLQRERVTQNIKNLQNIIKTLDGKIEKYTKTIETGIDFLNPQDPKYAFNGSKDCESCEDSE